MTDKPFKLKCNGKITDKNGQSENFTEKDIAYIELEFGDIQLGRQTIIDNLQKQLEEANRIKEKYRHDDVYSQVNATFSNAIILEENQKYKKVIDEIRKKYLGSCDLVCDDCGFNTKHLKAMLDEAEKYDYTKRGLYFQECDCKILSDGEDDNTIKACKKHVDLIVKEIHKFNSEAEK